MAGGDDEVMIWSSGGLSYLWCLLLCILARGCVGNLVPFGTQTGRNGTGRGGTGRDGAERNGTGRDSTERMM